MDHFALDPRRRQTRLAVKQTIQSASQPEDQQLPPPQESRHEIVAVIAPEPAQQEEKPTKPVQDDEYIESRKYNRSIVTYQFDSTGPDHVLHDQI